MLLVFPVRSINGRFGSESSFRSSSLLEAISTNNNAIFTQNVHANWSRESAEHKAFKLLKRYPDISIIGCASNTTALGAIDAVEFHGLLAGK